MITLEEFKARCEEFEKVEGRASFYEIALEIVDEYPLQAAIIILATWNIGRFRFVISPENLLKLKETLKECEPTFLSLRKFKFREVNFDKLKDKIESIYAKLSSIEGVKYTGASKVFHLFCKDLIVMWDRYIREEYKKKEYARLYGLRLKGHSPQDFFKFQKLMQKIFGHIEWNDEKKSLAKAIDEYNYVMFTLPKRRKSRKF